MHSRISSNDPKGCIWTGNIAANVARQEKSSAACASAAMFTAVSLRPQQVRDATWRSPKSRRRNRAESTKIDPKGLS
jgi:hypothetical protein